MSNSFYHKDLTDAQWNRIKFVFEKREKVGRPSLNPRTVFNAIMWILKSGGRWRDLPSRYLSGVELGGKKILADRAYSSEQIRLFIAEHGAVSCIPNKVSSKVKHDFDSELYKQRNIVERFFQRIKNYRHISTRFDKLAFCFENFVLLVASVIHF